MPENPFPIIISTKVNSPALLAWFTQFGDESYLTAEEINKLKAALEYLYASFSDLGDFSDIYKGPVNPASTAEGTGVAIWTSNQAGTYSNFGGVVVNENSFATIFRNEAGDFSISQMEIALDGFAEKNEIFDYVVGKNKFNKLDVVNGFYISTTTGSLAPNAPSIVSNWIPIDATKFYRVSGRNTGELRFRNSIGTILKPYTSAGVESVYYDGNINGIIYPPPTAIEVQFTVTVNGAINANATQLEEGVLQTSYENFNLTPFVKPNLINEANLDLSAFATNNFLFERVNLFDKTNVITGFYISNSAGTLAPNAPSAVSSVILIKPNTIYYLQGKTTAQMEVVFYNSVGTKLKAYTTAGVEELNFGVSTFGTGWSVFMSPPTAVSVQFTIKFSVGEPSGYDTLMLSESTQEVPYRPYTDLVVKSELLPNVAATEEFNGIFKIIKSSANLKIRTSFDGIHDIILTFDNNDYINGLYNIVNARLLTKTEIDNATGIVLNGTGGDDSAPTHFNNRYLGGNHGGPAYLLTKTAHGKTLADVGSVYTDANSNQYVILKIDSVNTFSVGIKNTSITETWTFPAPVSPLTYVSNGSSTSAVSFTAISSFQLYPSVNNRVQKLMIDNVVSSDEKIYYGDNVNIIETYDIVDYPDMLTKLTANRPGGGYLTQPDFTNGDAIISVTNIFNIQPKGTVSLVNSWSVEKAINLNGYFGITQNGYVTPTWATTCRRYFPKTFPITNNGNTFDFRMKPEFKTPVITGYIGITSEFWEGGKPVNRVVDMLQSSGLNVNFNLGYLPLGGDRDDLINNAWEMTSTKKLYPRYVDGKIGVSNVVTAGTVIQGVAFRGWSKPSGIRTNEFLVENGGKHYLYLDFHAIGTDVIELPSYLLGKTVSVIDKSANITLITSIVTGFIKVKVTTASPLYGYCELLIQ